MILDSYQCSSCYFEDKEPSTRIDPATISPAQPRISFNDVLVVFVCIERYDSRQELEEAANEFGALANLLGKRPIVLCPNVHLSIDKAPEKQAIALITELEKMLKERGYRSIGCLSAITRSTAWSATATWAAWSGGGSTAPSTSSSCV